MSSVALSSGSRSILLSLQNSAALTSTIQNRLATGKKVNSAIDNPNTFFTALSLGSRASNLAALLDNIGQAQQTLKAANQGLDALVKLVQAAKSLAQQARLSQLPQISYSAIEQTGSADISGEAAGSVTGSVDTSGTYVANADGLQIQVGASTYTVHPPSAPTREPIQAIISDINNIFGLGPNGAVTAALDPSGKNLTLTANSPDTSFQVLSSTAATALGIAGQTGTSTNLLQAVSGLSGTSMMVQASGAGAKMINFGDGGGQVSTLAELQSALAGSGVTASLNGQNMTLTVDASSGPRNSLTTRGSALAALGLPAAGTQFGAVNSTDPDPARASLQAQYSELLHQIDTLAQDSSYGSINLLTGDKLHTAFNESGGSALTIAGVSFDAAGLGLPPVVGLDFQSNPVVDAVGAALDAALTKLRAQASTFGSSLTTLQTRQDFTKNLINTLQTGTDGLVLADTNEESANLLALQTRQGLSLTALSLAAQSDQAILKLFR